MFLDAWWFDGWAEPWHGPLQFEDIYISGDSMEAMGDFCVNRHDGYLHGLFLDFSVRKIGLKELWKLKWHRTFDVSYPPPVWPPWMQNFKDY